MKKTRSPRTSEVAAVLRILTQRFQDGAKTASDRRSRFAVLVSTILSARTKDEVTFGATVRLLHTYPTAQDLATASVRRVAALVYPVGFFRTKARHLVAAAQRLVREFGGRVPRSRTELLLLPGVGRKTANVVLNYAFREPAIAVDTHVHRITNRLGWLRTQRPGQTEQQLEHLVPRTLWIQVNDLLVKFGKDTCKPVTPQCWRCPIVRFCRYPHKDLVPSGRRRAAYARIKA